MNKREPLEVNGRTYQHPREPTAVICVDGFGPDALEDALNRGLMPRVAAGVANGVALGVGEAQIPSLTNPNNMCIVTGVPAAVHGISGNHFLNPDGDAVQLNDPSYLRAGTIYAGFAAEGATVACVTAKDKLRRMLATGGVISLSAELAHELPVEALSLDRATDLLGRENPGVYDPACSIYALEMGLELAKRLDAGLVYVSLTDYVQHTKEPGSDIYDEFYRQLDARWGAFVDEGFVVGLTADHGMSLKARDDGTPNVRYLTDELAAGGLRDVQVILPITDPYNAHHATLGSVAWVYVDHVDRAMEILGAVPGIDRVVTRDQAVDEFELPGDRIGDIAVLAAKNTVVGKSVSDHDLSGLHGQRLRSHGGLHERSVPILVSRPLESNAAARLAAGELRNADIHDLVLNRLA